METDIRKENLYLKRRCIELEHENRIFSRYAGEKITVKNLDGRIKESKKLIRQYRKYIREKNMEIRKMQNEAGREQKQNEAVHGVAYKSNVTREKVLELKERGMGVSRIAEELEVSRQTVYNRLKEG